MKKTSFQKGPEHKPGRIFDSQKVQTFSTGRWVWLSVLAFFGIAKLKLSYDYTTVLGSPKLWLVEVRCITWRGHYYMKSTHSQVPVKP